MPEYFRFLTYVWDVERALTLVEQRPREVVPLPVAQLRGALSLMQIDPRHAETADLTRPVLIGYLVDPTTPFVLDGHHRIYRAVQEQRETLPTVWLTPEENDQVLISRPPGSRRRRHARR